MKETPLDLTHALGHEATDKRVDMLRRIGEVGSISEAARCAGVSYKAAWQAIETLSNLAGQDLVETVVGGSGGGGAQLTTAGRRLLRAADELAIAQRMVMARISAEMDCIGLSSLAGLALRTSIRNQIPCTVQGMDRMGAAVSVQLALPGGALLRSRITAESAELLSLQAGMPALALCKATAVSIATKIRKISGTNLLHGIVTRASKLADDREACLRLGCGTQWVGFIAGTSPLPVDRPAMAAVEESAVAIALPM
jgi:molybdate transport system regulatory protein